MTTSIVEKPQIVSRDEWIAARTNLLAKEKQLTRERDALAAERRRMPWVAVEKQYEFDGPNGKVKLLDLFEARRQLIVYRAFFEPGVFGWPDHACRGCSLGAEQVSNLAHLHVRDTTLAYVSRAPHPDIERLKQRMDWKMPWYSFTGSFDIDFGVDQWHGTNAFIRDGDKVFLTYFINKRGDEALGTVWSYLDMTALGRQENWEGLPAGYPQTPPYKWWNWSSSRKFSYFEELFKKPPLRDWMANTAGAEDMFVEWVGTGKLDQGVQVRELPSILDDPEAMAALSADGFHAAQKVLAEDNPVVTSKLFRRMVEMTEALRKAQLDDVQRVRQHNGSKARRILDELSESLEHFLELCGTRK